MTITPDGRNITDVILCNPLTGAAYSATGGGGGGAALVETLWTDDNVTPTYYVRQDNGSSIAWYTPLGVLISPFLPSAGLRPAGGANIAIDSTRYQATAVRASDIAIGDYLAHIVTFDPSTGLEIANFWLNATQSTKLATAPSSAIVTPISPLPVNAAKETGGNLDAINTKLGGTLVVASNVAMTGSLTINSSSSTTGWISIGAFTHLTLVFNASFVGTLVWEGSNDGGVTVTPISINGLNGFWGTSVSNPQTGLPVELMLQFMQVRLRCSVYTSGTGSLQWMMNAGSTIDQLVSQGPSASISGGWYQKLTDGTNGPVAVKAPSVSPVASDPALVVVVSPNSTSAMDGTDSSAATAVGNSASGIRGWLSGIYTVLKGGISVSALTSAFVANSFVDGADVTQGTKADTAYAGGGGAATIVSIAKGLYNAMVAPTPGFADSAITNVSLSGLTTAFSVATAGYGRLVFQFTTAPSGGTSITFQGSNDNATWYPVYAFQPNAAAYAPVTTTGPGSYTTNNLVAGALFEIVSDYAYTRMISTSAAWTGGSLQWVQRGTSSRSVIAFQGSNIAGGTWAVQAKSTISGGIPSINEVYGTVTPTITTVKSTAGQIYAIDLTNNAATWAYLHIFQGSPTLGTTSAYITYALPPNSSRTISFGDLGLVLSSIYSSISLNAPQNDNTSLALANTAIAVFHYA